MPVGVRQRHQRGPAHPGLDVLLGDTCELQGGDELGDHRCDGYDPITRADSSGEIGGVRSGMLGRIVAGHRHTEDPVAADRVSCDCRYHRGVDPTGHAEHDGAEPVLTYVVPRPGDQRSPNLGLVADPVGHRACRSWPIGCGRRRRVVPVHDHRQSSRWGGRIGDCQRERQVDQVDALYVLRRPQQQGTVRADHHRVAVEDQLVLSSDGIHVGDGGARLSGPPLQKRQSNVVLVALVR